MSYFLLGFADVVLELLDSVILFDSLFQNIGTNIFSFLSPFIIGIMTHSLCLATNRWMMPSVTIVLMSKFIVFLTMISRKFNIVIVFRLFFSCCFLIGISVLCTFLISKLFDADPDKQLCNCKLYFLFQGSTWNGRKGKGKGKQQDWAHHCSKGHGAKGRARWHHGFLGTICVQTDFLTKVGAGIMAYGFWD